MSELPDDRPPGRGRGGRPPRPGARGNGKPNAAAPRGGDARAAQSRDDDDDAALRKLRDKLATVLGRLPDIERKVLERRMGLADGIPQKPGQVADELGLSIPEVRKIEGRAFERIREVGPIKGLERFLER